MACQRNKCFNDCSNKGVCLPMKILAQRASRQYDTPWDALKIWGCLCDNGYRGPDCSEKECVSFSDPLGGFGNESGRDCSGRGTCNYGTGLCECFSGFYGDGCENYTIFEVYFLSFLFVIILTIILI